MRKGFTLVALVLIALLAATGAAGYLLIKQTSSGEGSSAPETESQPSATATPVATPVATALPNWTVYESPRFGYAFRYPPTWVFSPFNERDEGVLAGSHALASYDTLEVQKYMDHGAIDWQAFIGDKPAIKVDLTAVTMESPDREALLALYYGAPAVEQPKSNIQIGGFPTVYYKTPEQIGNGMVHSYVAFPTGVYAIMVNVFVANLGDKELEATEEWQELKLILSSFEFK